ncbi:MAG: tetratricopeptide repeat protein, partial [Flavobacteriales bacterium]
MSRLYKFHITCFMLAAKFLLVSQCMSQYTVRVGKDTFYLSAGKKDSAIVNLMFDKSKELQIRSPKLALQYAGKALALSQKLAFRPGIAKASVLLGDLAEDKGLMSQAYKHFLTAYSQYKKMGDIAGQVEMLNRIGVIFNDRGELSKAMEQHYNALRLSEKKKYQRGIADALFYIGQIQAHQGLNEQVEETYRRVVQIADSLGYTEMTGKIYNLNGIDCINKGEYSDAIDWFEKYLDVVRKSENTKALAAGYNNIGVALKRMGRYEQAKKYYYKSLSMTGVHGDVKNAMFAENSIGELYYVQKQYDKAIEHKNKSLEYAKSMGAMSMISHLYKDLFMINVDKGAYKDATDYMAKIIAMNDTLNIQNIVEKTAEMQAKYESERKQKQIEIQRLKLGKQGIALRKSRLEKYALFGGLSLTLIVALLLYNRYLVKRKANRELEEKNKIIRKQKDSIVDSINYAERIQLSVLPEEKRFNKHFKDYFIYYKPRDIVSGDFYWFVERGGWRIVAVADCTGHGVPGAFMSMIGNMLLREIVLEKNISDPDRILAELHHGIVTALQQERGRDIGSQDGMDVALCSIPPECNKVYYAGAMNPLYIVRKG